MAVQLRLRIQLFYVSVAYVLIPGVVSTTFTITNKCNYAVWPGILSNADSSPFATTGFTLQQGETRIITAPASWGGRLWGRTHCSQDTTGKFTCLTGDCGPTFECSGRGAAPPATLAKFKLDGYGGLDYFNVSLVDGYNLPLTVTPQGGSGQNCSSTGCVVDLNGACPKDLKVTSTDGESVACKSACQAFGQPEYCCNGAYSTPDTCKPSSYSEIFKKACPLAYSYAYDDKTSTFTCASADYLITFCPSPNVSQKSSQGQNSDTPTTTATRDGEMMHEGAAGSGLNRLVAMLQRYKWTFLGWATASFLVMTFVAVARSLVLEECTEEEDPPSRVELTEMRSRGGRSTQTMENREVTGLDEPPHLTATTFEDEEFEPNNIRLQVLLKPSGEVKACVYEKKPRYKKSPKYHEEKHDII